MRAAVSIKNHRELITPDGVPLNLELATYGERASALLIDLAIMGFTFLAVLLTGMLLLSSETWEFLLIIMILAFFFIRSFYFIFFEIKWQGATPGKKAVGLKVIDRKGGVLKPEAIFARNLMREVELWLPITLFFVQDEIGIEKLFLIMNLIWIGIFVLLPLFNKDRLRAGDMIGDTLVIRSPKVKLLSDPFKTKPNILQKEGDPDHEAKFTFTVKQLDVYGIFELQTLEKVLRSKNKDAGEIMATVAAQIAEKIGWRAGSLDNDHEKFLTDFYVAMRKHHEAQLLFGKRKKDKFDGARTPEPKEKKTPRTPGASQDKPYSPRRKRRR